MKTRKLAVIAALMCCIASQTCSAQVIILGENQSVQGKTSPVKYKLNQLPDPFAPPDAAEQQAAIPEVSDNNALAPVVDLPTTSIINEAPSIENPFSKLTRPSLQTEDGFTGESGAKDAVVQPSTEEQGLPVGRHHRNSQTQRSMVDTILHYGSLDGVPDANLMPVQWPTANGNLGRTNPIGHYMLQNRCVAGLWANYPAQRAAECRCLQQKLAAGSGNTCNRYQVAGAQQLEAPSEPCGNCTVSGQVSRAQASIVPVTAPKQFQKISPSNDLPSVPASTESRPVVARQPFGTETQQYR